MSFRQGIYLPGVRYASLAQHAVNSLLGTRKRRLPVRVLSGNRFYNVDFWPWKILGEEIFKQLQANKGRAWKVQSLHKKTASGLQKVIDMNITPHIVVGQVPDGDVRRGSALIGGCYHEAFHNLYSLRGRSLPTTYDPVLRKICSLAAEVEAKDGAISLFRDLYQLIEDIRIERVGRKEFPGTYVPLCDLHDYAVEVLEKDTPLDPVNVLVGLFRELGKGYRTTALVDKIRRCRTAQPDIAAFFDDGGVLKDILEACKKPQEELFCITAALECVLKLQDFANDASQPQESREKVEELLEKGRSENGGDVTIVLGDISDLPEDIQGQIKELMKEEAQGKAADKDGKNGPKVKVLVSGKDLFGDVTALKPPDPEETETPWNPADPSLDEIVRPRQKETAKGKRLFDDAMRITTGLRGRLQVILRNQELSKVWHGVPQGRRLSSRMLVSTALQMKAGETPRNPFSRVEKGYVFNPAVALCLDLSSSMYSGMKDAVMAAMAIASPLEILGGKTFIFGIQSGDKSARHRSGSHHRFHNVHYILFKEWRDSVRASCGVLGAARARGGTPLSDGVFFGMRTLLTRQEKRRVLMVVTDGQPDPGHTGVIKYLLRAASSLDVHVVGIGIGQDAHYVKVLFPNHVWVEEFEELPKALLDLMAKMFITQTSRF